MTKKRRRSSSSTDDIRPAVINAAHDIAQGQAEDAYFARMFAELGRLGPAEKKILRRQLGESLKAIRVQLRHYRQELRQAIASVKSERKVRIAEIRQQKKALREQYRRDFEALHRQEVDALRAERSELARLRGTPALVAASERQRRVKSLSAQLDELTGAKDRRRKAYVRQQEQLQESNQAVAYDLASAAPEALAWWDRHQNDPKFRKPPAKMSRTEMVLHYLHENPETVQHARIEAAEKLVQEHEAKEQALATRHTRLGRGRVPLGTRRLRAVAGATARRRAGVTGRDSDKFSGSDVPF